MKEKIFNKMAEYGWKLNNFNDIYNYHYNFINELYERNKENDSLDADYISDGVAWDSICFMNDFLRAINELDNGE